MTHHHETHDQHGAMLDLLELDATVLRQYWTDALDWVAAAAPDASRIVDLGAGIGTAALGLAERFPEASVVAVDVESSGLDRLRARAGDRIETVVADLDRGWPALGEPDLIWASMSLHHLADPDRTLREARAAAGPGAVVAVAEFAEPLRFLDGDLAGFEEELLTTLRAAHAEELPTLGSDWSPRLTQTGWTVTAERAFPVELRPAAVTEDLAAYARAWFDRLSEHQLDRLEPPARSRLADLLTDLRDPGTAPPVHVRGVRTITLGHA